MDRSTEHEVANASIFDASRSPFYVSVADFRTRTMSQGTKDKKLIAQIAGLNRVLAKMDAQSSDSSQPRNRQ
jgi:hypothetical protein